MGVPVDTWTETAPRRPPASRWTVVLTAVVVFVLVVAVVVLSVVVVGQRSRLASAQAKVAQFMPVTGKVADQDKLLHQQQAAVSGLQSQLLGYGQRLKSDEQQLSHTQKSLPPDVTHLAKVVSKSVVLISCAGGFGSGFALDLPPEPGYSTVLVTAAHVVSDCADSPDSVTVTRNGVTLTGRLRVVDTTPTNDVALIDIVEKLPELTPSKQEDQPGQFVLSLGTPFDTALEGSVTTGEISKVSATYFLHTAPTSNGNSGGPLVDRDGRVLGFADASIVASADTPVVENLNIAHRLNVLCAIALPTSSCAYS
jgi:S1-C subfamily serine protease